jgi:iron complex outermembrane receptor protein
LASTIIFGAGLALAGSAFAADNDQKSSTNVGEIVVTGSRIPVSNVTANAPISVATSQQIALTNSFSVGDVLTKLAGPDYSGGLSGASNNGGVGLSEIGLRNLGPARTLVLIDGQRLVPIFSGAASVPDLNSVPVSMVDRIEVLRDGASSVYGADAIGGVINIITKKNFEGLQLDGSGGLTQHGGGADYSVGGTIGFNSDKGNLTVSILHEYLNPVDQTQRAWAQDAHIGGPFEGGSIYRSQLNILQDELTHTVWYGPGSTETTYNNSALGTLPCLTFLPNTAGGRVKLNAGCPDVFPHQALTSGLERTQISWNGHYNITDHVRMVVSGFFTDRHSEQRLRPEPLLGDSIASTYPATGAAVYGGFEIPELPAFGFTDPNHTASHVPCTGNPGVPCLLAFLTPDEWGPRDYQQTSHTYRIRAGFEGDLPFHDFKWEAGFVNQRNDTQQRIYNGGNWLHLAEETGQIPCTSAPGGCTFSPLFGYNIPTNPVNFFHEPNGMTPDQIAYLTYTAIDNNYSYENYAYADVNGKLFDLPYGPLKAALGVERRYEFLADNPDALVQQGLAAGPTGPTAGGYNVTSVYGELRIPILAGMPGFEDLSLDPSARWDHYSNFGDAKTYKIGGEWKITQDVRLRASWAVGFRAPSTAELFGGHAISYISVGGDPCDVRGVPGGFNGNPNANGSASLAAGSACYASLAAIGLTPAQIANYQSAENNLVSDQRGLILGGNATLKPEKSNQWNVGVVVTPRWTPGFSFNADFYQVHIHNTIITGGLAGALGPDLIVNGCFVSQNPTYCALITRNNSGIFQIGSENTNFGLSWIKGLDMEATYDTAAAGLMLPFPGSVRLNAQVERQFQNKQQNPDGSVSNYNGFFLYSNESVQPKWKGRASIDYKLGTWIFHYDGQWIGHAFDLGGTSTAYGDYLPDVFYHNISVSFELPNVGPVQRTTMVLGINNLFDKDPPFLGADSICKCNSFAGPYDFYGRDFFARVSAKF